MSFRRRALFLAGLFAAVSCSDAGNPLGPDAEPPVQPGPGEVLATLTCTVSVDSPDMRCVPPSAGTGGALGNVAIIGGPNGENVLLTKLDHNADADSMWFDVTLQNLIGQTLGTVDGVNEDADSIRVFFASDPTPVGGGNVSVGHPDGAAPITTGAPQPYYQYPGMLADSATTAPHRWHFNLSGGVSRFTFTVFVRAKVQFPEGWVRILPDSASLEIGGVDSLLARVRDRFGGPLGDAVTWSVSNSAALSVAALTDSTAEITGVAEGQSYVHAVSVVNANRRDSILVKVANVPVVALDSIDGLTNVTDSIPAADGLAANVPAGSSIVPGTYVTADSGTATVYADGSYTYRSRAGAAGVGKDTIFYPVTNGAWTVDGKVVVQVALSRYWYVQPGAAGDGRDRSPFGSLADAVAAAADLDSIFVLSSGAAQLEGGVTLKAGQSLIGQGIPTSVTRSLNGRTHTLLAAGSAASITRTDAGAAITLATNNAIQGLGITAADGAAIAGTSFGTLFVRHTGVNPRGPALLLTTGALDAEFDVLSSTESNTTGLSLTSVTGSLTGTGGSLANATAGALVIAGGDGTITYGGSVVDTMSSAQSIDISGRTGGAVTISGTLALDSLGIRVHDNTGGTIAFSGTSKTLRAGSHAGVVLANNTGADVSFAGGGLVITTSTGAGFGATGGGTVEVTGAGNTITSGTGTALALNGVGTGVAGVSWQSVSADGAVNGIALANLTGAGVQVIGTGTTAGSGGTIQNTTGHAVSLATMTGADSVRLQYVNVGGGAGGNAGIFGADFGTLRVVGLSVGVTGGPALSLSTGTLNGGFSSLGSASSASSGVILTSVGGAFTAAAGSIDNATSTGFAVVGGTVAATYQGGMGQGVNIAPLVAVSGGHTGALTFNTGALGASTGTGLSFNDADGAYSFDGTTTLNGGDAGIDITNGSAGTFAFGTGTAITSPSGTAFNVYGSSPTVTYSGSLAQSSGALLVDIGEQPGGSITFQTGTLSASAGDGIQLSNADGSVLFTGTTTLNGGAARISVINGSDGVFDFGINTNVLATTATALDVDLGAGGGTPALVYRGAVTTSAGRVASVAGLTGDSVMVVGNFSSGTSGAPTGLGLLVQNNTGGKVGFNGTSKALFTGTSPAVTLASNTGAQIEFRGGGLAVTTTTGAGIAASGGGTVSATGAGNAVTTSTGTPVSLNGVATGVDGVVLANVSTSGAANGVLLTNVTGTGVAVFGGTITSTTGASLAISGGSAGLDYRGTVNQMSAGAALLSVTGGHSGAVSVPSGTLEASNGTGLQFDNADGSYTFGGTVTLNGGDAGIDVLNNSGGTFTFPATASIANPTGSLVSILNSAPAFTYSGAFTKTNNSVSAIVAQSNTGGTIAFDGSGVTKSISSGTAAAVSLVNNGGATFNFAGGSLAITSTSGAGFSATGGGTVNVTGASNTVASAGGTAVNVQNTTIGASGLSFRSVSASGGANGIVLVNTGGTNGLQVTGDGSTVGSGGTIASTSGGDGAMAGNGVYLSGARNVSLHWMALSGHANNGLYGSGVTNLTMNRVRFTGNNGTSNSGAFEESPVHLVNSGGTIKITSSRLDGGAWNGFLLRNTVGGPVVDSLVLENDTVSSMQGSTSDVRNTALQALIESGTADIRMRSNHLTYWWGNAIQVKVDGAGSATARITSNVISQTSGALAGAGGIGVTGGNLAFNVSGNSVNGTNGTAISADKIQGNTFFNGTIDGNTVGTPGVANSGSAAGTGIFVAHAGPNATTVKVTNNTIRQVNGTQAVWALIGDNVGGGGAGTLNATITGNNIAEEGTALSTRTGIVVQSGRVTGDTDVMCADVASNSITNFNTRIRPNQRFNTTMRMPGYSGAPGATADVNSYLQGRNPGTISLSSASTAGGGGYFNTVPAGSACPQPAL